MPHIRFLLGLLCLALPVPAYAFADWQGENRYGDARLLLRGFAIADRNPDTPLYAKRNEQGLGGIARLIMERHEGDNLAWQFNAYQTTLPAFMTGYASATAGVERSGLGEWNLGSKQPGARYTHLAIDNLNLRYSHGSVDIIAGRQPINLATTFYFTPNDLFAPFAAQTFYRTYKPGVDALRTEVRLGQLSQLSMIVAAGYRPDATRAGGWSIHPDSKRTAWAARFSTVQSHIEWGLLAARVQRANLYGGSLQGNLFDWVGMRMEGHITHDQMGARRIEFVGGIKHRFESSLGLRAEYYYHGAGATDVANYAFSTTGSTSTASYPGRRYIAAGGSYEFTPLLTGDAVAITNLDDRSWLASVNAIYSLADEAELVLNGNIPFGKKPQLIKLNSEFGSYPASLLLEVRAYF
jgi:hypothetical protein